MRFLSFPFLTAPGVSFPSRRPRAAILLAVFCLFFLASPASSHAFAGGQSVSGLYARANARNMSLGQRIAWFARQFIGTPYDRDPLGAYVTRKAIVADDSVDCMYHVFRSVELALAGTPEGAQRLALLMRFKTVGRLSPDGKVLNYDDRYQYGLDMILSGKWGRNITSTLGSTMKVPTSRRFMLRGVFSVQVLPKNGSGKALGLFKSGDIVFFVKNPARRVVGEVIGHMGILSRQNGKVYLIHAHGTKETGGAVAQVLFSDYAKEMPFIGIMVTRFN